jgi:hypothetical protein
MKRTVMKWQHENSDAYRLYRKMRQLEREIMRFREGDPGFIEGQNEGEILQTREGAASVPELMQGLNEREQKEFIRQVAYLDLSWQTFGFEAAMYARGVLGNDNLCRMGERLRKRFLELREEVAQGRLTIQEALFAMDDALMQEPEPE